MSIAESGPSAIACWRSNEDRSAAPAAPPPGRSPKRDPGRGGKFFPALPAEPACCEYDGAPPSDDDDAPPPEARSDASITNDCLRPTSGSSPLLPPLLPAPLRLPSALLSPLVPSPALLLSPPSSPPFAAPAIITSSSAPSSAPPSPPPALPSLLPASPASFASSPSPSVPYYLPLGRAHVVDGEHAAHRVEES